MTTGGPLTRLRVADPLPLGFLALAIATFAFATLQLRWVAADQGHPIALGMLVLTVPAQLVASLMGFLDRNPVAGTGMGVLAGTWAGLCLATLTSPPGTTSAGLGVVLLCAAVALLVPAAGAVRLTLAAALVVSLSALRFAVTGVAELAGGSAWLRASGWVGVVLAGVSAGVALALELRSVGISVSVGSREDS